MVVSVCHNFSKSFKSARAERVEAPVAHEETLRQAQGERLI